MSYKHRAGRGIRVAKQCPSMKADKKMHSIKGGRQSVTVSLDLQGLNKKLTWNLNDLLKEKLLEIKFQSLHLGSSMLGLVKLF